jgi:secreted Zn-dependent insulinase-like peptidase
MFQAADQETLHRFLRSYVKDRGLWGDLAPEQQQVMFDLAIAAISNLTEEGMKAIRSLLAMHLMLDETRKMFGLPAVTEAEIATVVEMVGQLEPT